MPTVALRLQISTELQAYAKEHGLNGEMEARSVGMEEMSEQFRSIGAEVYMVSPPATTVPLHGCGSHIVEHYCAVCCTIAQML
jgi:hypothetical protein